MSAELEVGVAAGTVLGHTHTHTHKTFSLHLVLWAYQGKKIRKEFGKEDGESRNPGWREVQMRQDSRNQHRRPTGRKGLTSHLPGSGVSITY